MVGYLCDKQKKEMRKREIFDKTAFTGMEAHKASKCVGELGQAVMETLQRKCFLNLQNPELQNPWRPSGGGLESDF